MRGVNTENVEDVFTFHAPESEDQLEAYVAIRTAAQGLAETILACAPVCADQQAAIRKVREAVMTANAAVALKGAV